MWEKPRARRLVIDGRRLTTNRTGVGRYLETLLEGWAETRGPFGDVVVVAQDRSGVDRLRVGKGIRIEVVGQGWPGLVWEWFGLGRILRKHDVLFAPTNLIPRVWRGTTILVIFDTLLEAVPEGFSRAIRWRFRSRYRSAARRATLIIVPSDSTHRDVVRYYDVDPRRVRTIYPSVGAQFRPRAKDDPLVAEARRAVGLGDAPFFLFIGKRSKRRNVPAVLSAFARYRVRFLSHRLVFVGPGDAERGNKNGVIVAGHVADEVLVGLLVAATGCLYPSDYEGFGLPVIEAMACGCPVVTLRASALVESGGEAAYYLDGPDAGSIERAMVVLSTNAEFRGDLVAKGLIQASKFQGRGFADMVKSAIEEAGLDSSVLHR